MPPQPPTPNPDLGTYHDTAGFTIQYPLNWQRSEAEGYPVAFVASAVPGTNLIEKRMEINVVENSTDCRQSTYGAETTSTTPEHRFLGNADFFYQIGSGIAAGNIYDWTSYSTTRNSSCITITFVLHSSSSGVYGTEPPPFDRAAESAVFTELMHTFRLDP
jgi:hypothetical protein